MAAPVVTRSQTNLQTGREQTNHEAEVIEPSKTTVQSEREPDEPRNMRQLVVAAHLFGARCRSLVDSGATLSFVSEEFLKKKLNPRPKLVDSNVEIILGNGEQAESKGMIKNAQIYLKGVGLDIELHVLPLPSTIDVILGTLFLARHKAQICIAGQFVSFSCIDKSNARPLRKTVAGVATLMAELPDIDTLGEAWPELEHRLVALHDPKRKRQKGIYQQVTDNEASTIEIVSTEQLQHEISVQEQRTTKALKSNKEPPETYVMTIGQAMNKLDRGDDNPRSNMDRGGSNSWHRPRSFELRNSDLEYEAIPQPRRSSLQRQIRSKRLREEKWQEKEKVVVRNMDI